MPYVHAQVVLKSLQFHCGDLVEPTWPTTRKTLQRLGGEFCQWQLYHMALLELILKIRLHL